MLLSAVLLGLAVASKCVPDSCSIMDMSVPMSHSTHGKTSSPVILLYSALRTYHPLYKHCMTDVNVRTLLFPSEGNCPLLYHKCALFDLL